MAGWRYRETVNGDIATIRLTVGNILIDGEVVDCDGDCVAYQVKENDSVIAHGEFHINSDLTSFKDCWDAAMNAANKAIAINPNPNVKSRERVNHNPKPKSFAQPNDESDGVGFQKNYGHKGRKNSKRNGRPRDHGRYTDY